MHDLLHQNQAGLLSINSRYTQHSYSPPIFPSLPSLSGSFLIIQPYNIHNSQSKEQKSKIKIISSTQEHENTNMGPA